MSRRKKSQPILISVPDLPITFSVRNLPDSFAAINTDMLVLVMHEHMKSGPGLAEVDAACGGALSATMEAKGFHGGLGQSILVATGQSGLRHVLVVGLGAVDNARSRVHYCGFVALLLENARNIGAKHLTLPFFPGRSEEINLMGMLAVLRCRSQHSGQLGDLRQLEILCTPQAKRWVLEGLSVEKSLCQVCSHPQIGRES